MNIAGLEIVHENASYLAATDNVAFNAIRKNGLGASDASAFLGLMAKWKSPNDLIAEKLRTEPTAEDLAISEKEAVRKGVDLEPLILSKFVKLTGAEVLKPEPMYRIEEFPYLTVNFDGLIQHEDGLIPVECKFVSKFGGKYWAQDKAIETMDEPWDPLYNTGNLWESMAQSYGPPAYYIAQIQQQLLATGAPYGYFSVIFDDGWKHMIFRVPANEECQRQIILEGYKIWNQIKSLRG